MKDTRFGKLINLAFKQRYGDNFQRERAIITKYGDKNYIVEISANKG